MRFIVERSTEFVLASLIAIVAGILLHARVVWETGSVILFVVVLMYIAMQDDSAPKKATFTVIWILMYLAFYVIYKVFESIA